MRQLRYEDAPDYDRLHALLLTLPSASKTRTKSARLSSSSAVSAADSKIDKKEKVSEKKATKNVVPAAKKSARSVKGSRQAVVEEDEEGEEEEVVMEDEPKVKKSRARKASAATVTGSSSASSRAKANMAAVEKALSQSSRAKPSKGKGKESKTPTLLPLAPPRRSRRGDIVSKQSTPATEVITISSDEEEGGDTPVKTKKYEVTSPSAVSSAGSSSRRSRSGDYFGNLGNNEDEEEEEGGDTPVKTREHKVTSPSPFLKRVASSPSVVSSAGNSSRRSSRSGVYIGNLGNDEEEDSEEEERGNTPIKVKKVKKSISPIPLTSAAASRKVLGLRKKNKSIEVEEEEENEAETFFQSRSSNSQRLSVTSGRKRSASSPVLPEKDELDTGALHNDAPRLYLEVLSSDCDAYVGRMWPLGGNGSSCDKQRVGKGGSSSWGNMHVVGSDGSGGCDVALEDDEYLSGRSARGRRRSYLILEAYVICDVLLRFCG